MKNLFGLLLTLTLSLSCSAQTIKDNSIVTRMLNTQTHDQDMTMNLGIAASVGSNALTISLKQANGSSDPTTLAPVSIAFRSSTAATGGFSIVKATAATSLVVPSTALLGGISGVQQSLWVYAINNAGAVELAVSGSVAFENNSIQSSTTIGTGADSVGVLYSTTGRSNVAVRLIGRLLVTEATAGTWATAPSDIKLKPTLKYKVTEWAAYTPTITAQGTVTNVSFWWRQNGPNLEVRGFYNAGTVTAAYSTITIPSGLSFDATRMGSNNILSAAGDRIGTLQSNGNAGYQASVLTAPATDPTLVYLNGVSSATATLVPNNINVNTFILTNSAVSIVFSAPIIGWYSYGT